MAAIKRLSNGNWVAVHEVTGKKLKGQPSSGVSKSKAIENAKDAAERVTGRRPSSVQTFQKS